MCSVCSLSSTQQETGHDPLSLATIIVSTVMVWSWHLLYNRLACNRWCWTPSIQCLLPWAQSKILKMRITSICSQFKDNLRGQFGVLYNHLVLCMTSCSPWSLCSLQVHIHWSWINSSRTQFSEHCVPWMTFSEEQEKLLFWAVRISGCQHRTQKSDLPP